MYHLKIHKYFNFEICIEKISYRKFWDQWVNFLVTSNIQMLIKTYELVESINSKYLY